MPARSKGPWWIVLVAYHKVSKSPGGSCKKSEELNVVSSGVTTSQGSFDRWPRRSKPQMCIFVVCKQEILLAGGKMYALCSGSERGKCAVLFTIIVTWHSFSQYSRHQHCTHVGKCPGVSMALIRSMGFSGAWY